MPETRSDGIIMPSACMPTYLRGDVRICRLPVFIVKAYRKRRWRQAFICAMLSRKRTPKILAPYYLSMWERASAAYFPHRVSIRESTGNTPCALCQHTGRNASGRRCALRQHTGKNASGRRCALRQHTGKNASGRRCAFVSIRERASKVCFPHNASIQERS